MHGHEVRAFHPAEHAPNLFGCGVHVFPGVVRADAEHSEVRARDAVEGAGVGGVAGEEDSARVVFYKVAVEASAAIDNAAGAPMGGREGGDAEAGDGEILARRDFVNSFEACGDEPGGAGCGDDGCAHIGERLKGWQVEVIEVGVGDEQQADAFDRGRANGAWHDALRADRSAGDANTDPTRQHRVYKDGPIAQLRDDRCVTQPGGGELIGSEFKLGGGMV